VPAAIVPCLATAGDIQCTDACPLQFERAVHIKATRIDVGFGITWAEASVEPLLGGHSRSTGGGGHFQQILSAAIYA
jgi:hypothetical protein